MNGTAVRYVVSKPPEHFKIHPTIGSQLSCQCIQLRLSDTPSLGIGIYVGNGFNQFRQSRCWRCFPVRHRGVKKVSCRARADVVMWNSPSFYTCSETFVHGRQTDGNDGLRRCNVVFIPPGQPPCRASFSIRSCNCKSINNEAKPFFQRFNHPRVCPSERQCPNVHEDPRVMATQGVLQRLGHGLNRFFLQWQVDLRVGCGRIRLFVERLLKR